MLIRQSFLLILFMYFWSVNECSGQSTNPSDVIRFQRHGNNDEIFGKGWMARHGHIEEWGITPRQEFIDISTWPSARLAELLQGWLDVGVELRVLVLGGCGVSSDHVLMASKLHGLQTLILDSVTCEIPNVDKDVEVILSQRKLIRELWASKNSLLKVVIEQKDGGARNGFLWEHSFVVVEVSRNRTLHPVIADPIEIALLERLACASSLRHLDLGGSNISDGDLKILTHFTDLQTLWLDDTKITDQGLRMIGGLPLKRLDISQTQSKGRIPALNSLLHLRMNRLTLDDSVALNSSDLQSLKQLELSGTQLSTSFANSVNSLPELVEVVCDKEFAPLFDELKISKN